MRNRSEGLKILALSGGERKVLATQERKGFLFQAGKVINGLRSEACRLPLSSRAKLIS